MEVQLTDFENAAFTVFVVLLTRVVLAFDLALYLPLSKVDENMRRAQEIDSVTANKFFFRKYLAPLERAVSGGSAAACGGAAASPSSSSGEGGGEPTLKKTRSSIFLNDPSGEARDGLDDGEDEDAYEEMTMAEIFHGKGPYYPGLLPLVYAYLDYIQCDPATHRRVDEYLQFIGQRANGEIKTTARWIRDFVTAHPSYQQDSVVPPDLATDLLMAAKNVGEGKLEAPELLGDPARVQKIDTERAYCSVLKGQLSAAERSELVSKYMQRATLHREEETPRGKARAPGPGR